MNDERLVHVEETLNHTCPEKRQLKIKLFYESIIVKL